MFFSVRIVDKLKDKKILNRVGVYYKRTVNKKLTLYFFQANARNSSFIEFTKLIIQKLFSHN